MTILMILMMGVAVGNVVWAIYSTYLFRKLCDESIKTASRRIRDLKIRK